MIVMKLYKTFLKINLNLQEIAFFLKAYFKGIRDEFFTSKNYIIILKFHK